MKHYLLLFGLTLALTACASCDPKPTPHPPTDTSMCPSACQHLRELGCEEGEPLEDGTTCEQFCKETQEQGHALNPTCVSKINTCEEITTCDDSAR